MGPGGVAANPFGWAFQHMLRYTRGHETTSLDFYDRVAATLGPEERELVGRAFLEGGELPARQGGRGRAMRFAIPQRERAEGAVDERLLGRENGAMSALVEGGRGELVLGVSEKEGYTDAVWLRERGRCPGVAGQMVSQCLLQGSVWLFRHA